MMAQFFSNLQAYSIEIIPALIIGFFLSGLAHEFIPQKWVDKNLGNSGLRAVVMSTFIGTLLPICCCGSLPIAISFYKKGAKLGPILAFLIATPATSISSLLVTTAILGIKFAVFIFFAVMLMGVLVGIVGNMLPYKRRAELDIQEECPHCHESAGICSHQKDVKCRMTSALKYGFWEMPREMGLELLGGILLAAFVAAYMPLGNLINQYLAGFSGYVFSLVFGLVTYICSTATVPLTDALIKQGLSVGAGMVMLLAGPVTSYSTILVMRKEFGLKVLFVYLFLLSIISLSLGYLYSLIAK
jgi:uncharacterized membrane protein YraQ (UPF0718 family)